MGKINHNKLHAIDSSADHTSTIIEDNLISADANGLPKDAGIASSNVKLHNTTATRVPVETDDSSAGYSVGSHWYFGADKKVFMCFDPSVGSSIWKLISSNGLVSNKTGSLIPKFAIVIPGTPQGGFPTIELADKSTEATSSKTIGIVIEDIANNEKGYIISQGNLYNIDTTGTPYSESWLIGDLLWLGDDGKPTKTIPVSPDHAVFVGIVVTVHANNGIASINLRNGFESNELHDVSNTFPATNEFLLHDGSIYIPTNFDTEVSANSDVVTNSAHSAGDGTDHTGVATTELDNLGTTAINADLLPSGDNLRDLGTSANKFKEIFAVDFTFEDPNADDFNVHDLAAHQLDAFNELATTRFNVTAATTGGVRTITVNQPDTEKLEFIINEKRLEQASQVDMTKTHTGLEGTDASPNNVYTYVKNTADAPDLTASNSNPNGVAPHVDVVYEKIGSISGSVANIYATNNVQASIYEKIEKMLDRFKEQGSIYKSGMDITADANTFTITSGTAKHVLSDATIPSLEIDRITPADDQFTIEDDSTYTTYTDFQIDEYYDGVTVANGHYVKCRIGAVINNPELTSARYHIIPQAGAAIYNTASQAWADLSGMARVTPRDNIVKYAFVPIADIVIKNTTGTFTLVAHPDTGLFYDDVRGVSTGGGGGGAASQNLFETISSDSGSTTADSSTDTLTIAGGSGVDTSVTADTLTVKVRRGYAYKWASDNTILATGDGVGQFSIPEEFNGMNLIGAHVHVYTASTSGTPTFQLHNLDYSGGASDMLTTKITIDVNKKDSSDATTPEVVDTTKDDVYTGDQIRIDCDVAGTGTKGGEVRLSFQEP
jgi:hypothetical protein